MINDYADVPNSPTKTLIAEFQVAVRSAYSTVANARSIAVGQRWRALSRSAPYGALLAVMMATSGCATAYYGALEKFGIEKRDILTDRVEDARDAQTDAKEQFTDALARYRSTIEINGGDLEKVYDRLNASFEKSESSANKVSDRIDAIESVATDLFKQWKEEIGEYSDASLRRQSEALLQGTQSDYRRMLLAMRRAEDSMSPVLSLFRDQVLFLRHNLNARAIGSLQSELRNIESATSAAIGDMERSIAEASRFIESMK